jgi:hypothetical protein
MINLKREKVEAIHPHWASTLLLSNSDRSVVHEANGSKGMYKRSNGTLTIYWERFAPETFVEIDGLLVHESMSGSFRRFEQPLTPSSSKRDLIIGCSMGYDWNSLKYWINSINRSGFDGDKVLVLMSCERQTAQKVTEAGFKVLSFQHDDNGNMTYEESKAPVHVERFLHI